MLGPHDISLTAVSFVYLTPGDGVGPDVDMGPSSGLRNSGTVFVPMRSMGSFQIVYHKINLLR